MSSYYEKMLATGEVKCIDEEIPFEIPQGWEWCRMGELISYQNGYAYTSSELNKEGKGLPVIKSGNLMTYEVVLKANNDYVENPSTKMLASAIKKGDLLMCLSSQSDNPEPLGKTAIYKANNTALLNQRVLKMRPWLEDMLDYMYYAINSEYFHYTVSHQGGGSAQANLKLGHVLSMLIPLAPLKEEIRIVDKINTIMPLVHQYETTFLKQKKLNSELNERLKSAILQEAIQGKLVPQINEEGTAQELLEQIKTEKQKLVKEGKLKKSTLNDSVIFRCDDNKYYEKIGKSVQCIDEEIPFEIPENWVWVRLDDICSYIHRGKSPKYSDIKKYPVVAQKCNQWSGFSLEKAKFIDPQSVSSYSEEQFLKDEDLMWNSTGLGTLGRMAIYDSRFNPYELAVADSHVTVIRPYKHYAMAKYLYFYFSSYTVQSVIEDKSDGSTKQKELATKTVKAYLVPLPPFAEQKRIVEKVNQLLQLLK
ncbi:restriction endonuclease subunit S [Segatella copri]|uniref:Restriction endonuclease subunit S n=2 Tax=Segatella copri TaxID=165179 RepID=A0AA92T6F9_9BACT|nr:restriction endonuclease subunit S [Segatella copri]RGN13258.1 restriction endonuclease subunit S [Segatella copri]